MTNLSGQVIKGYELTERIGAGGFGAVYKASQSTVGREVAVKVILPGLANKPDFIRRFEAEAQVIARLEHLHIVPLYDYWRDPDGAYLVMRWMRGGSLRDAISKDGACDLERAGQILDQMTAALAVAHRNNIIHRDLKPANVLLDEDGNAYLADFGIAKDISLTNGSITEPEAIVGSPDYLSPEQARSEAVTPATDVYSLGVVLYEMLTGTHPFPNVSTVERLFKHINEPLPQIDRVDESARDAINAVVQKATAKDPRSRYADALAFASAFREAAALGHPATAVSVVEMLTRKEQEILYYIVEGRTNKEIADQLFVTISTVKWYITQIYRKLHVRSRMQAIVRARELELVVHPGTFRSTSTDDSLHIATDQFQPENPYKGLRPFEAADFRDFFGRDRLIKRLVQRLGESGEWSRFLAVVGPSGSGKSSLVKAGLIPAVWCGELEGSEKWFVVEMVPGSRPLDELEVALTRVASTQTGNLHEQLKRDAFGLIRAVNMTLPDDGSELLLVIDQFEEVFTLIEDEPERAHFLKLIHAAVTERRSRVRVVITLRADCYDRPLHYPDFGELMRNRIETVLPLSVRELEAAIVGPAERVGARFETGLMSAIVEDIHYQTGALPLLQYALTELFERRDGHRLTHQAYDEMGRATGALAKRAEQLFREFDNDQQEYIRQMFLRLVTLGEGAEDSRQRTLRSELLELCPAADVMDDIIDTFVAYRLLSADHDPTSRKPTVEVAHEALLREWQRLSNWLIEDRDDIRSQQQLAQLTQDWTEANQDSSFLLRGARLQQFEAWSQQTESVLTSGEQAYLAASLANRRQEMAAEEARQAHELKLEKRARQFLRGLVAVMAVALVVAVSLTVIAQRNAAYANRNAQVSQSLSLASAAQAAAARENSEQALALAVVANQIEEPPVFAQRTLYEVGLAPGTQKLLDGGPGWRWIAEISPDRTMIAVLEGEVRVTIYDLATGEVMTQFDGNHPDGLGGFAFTPDSRYVLVGAWDDTLELWNLDTAAIVWEAMNPAGDPNSVAISPDGSLALVGSERGVVTLWNVESGEFTGQLEGHDPTLQVQGTAFSPDGRLAASASEDGTVIIWDVETRALLHRLDGHNQMIAFMVSFSPDGQMLASTGFDNNVVLWDVASGQMIRHLTGHTNFVFDVDWSADGSRLLSASRDSTLILWDAASGRALQSYRDEAGRALTVSFIDDGHAVSGGSSNYLRFWSLYDERELRNIQVSGDAIYSMAVRHDEQVAAVGSVDGVHLINLQTGDGMQRFSHLGGMTMSVAFSPDATTLFAGFEDSTIIQWQIASGEEVRRFEGHTATAINENVLFQSILNLAVSPDGRHFVSTAEDRSMIVWDINTGEVVRQVEVCSGTINGVTYSPDGRYMAAGFGALKEPLRAMCGEVDHSIHLWNAETGELVRQLVGHEEAVATVIFSPDGRWLVSGSVDETVRLWDVETGQERRRFVGHTGSVTHIDISADGRYIVSGSVDGFVHVWDRETGDLLRQIPAHAGEVTAAQFTHDSGSIFSASVEGTIRLWLPVLDLNDLQEWVSNYRHVRTLTCSEKQLYLLQESCD